MKYLHVLLWLFLLTDCNNNDKKPERLKMVEVLIDNAGNKVTAYYEYRQRLMDHCGNGVMIFHFNDKPIYGLDPDPYRLNDSPADVTNIRMQRIDNEHVMIRYTINDFYDHEFILDKNLDIISFKKIEK